MQRVMSHQAQLQEIQQAIQDNQLEKAAKKVGLIKNLLSQAFNDKQIDILKQIIADILKFGQNCFYIIAICHNSERYYDTSLLQIITYTLAESKYLHELKFLNNYSKVNFPGYNMSSKTHEQSIDEKPELFLFSLLYEWKNSQYYKSLSNVLKYHESFRNIEIQNFESKLCSVFLSQFQSYSYTKVINNNKEGLYNYLSFLIKNREFLRFERALRSEGRKSTMFFHVLYQICKEDANIAQSAFNQFENPLELLEVRIHPYQEKSSQNEVKLENYFECIRTKKIRDISKDLTQQKCLLQQ